MTVPDLQLLDQLRDAINSHDAARVAECFAEDFRAELPHHPDRSFTGAHHVLANWTNIFASATELTAKVLRSATSDGEMKYLRAMGVLNADGSIKNWARLAPCSRSPTTPAF
jgi:ketosteroid isomerase-like protein